MVVEEGGEGAGGSSHGEKVEQSHKVQVITLTCIYWCGSFRTVALWQLMFSFGKLISRNIRMQLHTNIGDLIFLICA
nr:hypothetical protein CFP56_48543 [Quercus suber]